jgi:DNA-binding NarL/FixJ family response regulator
MYYESMTSVFLADAQPDERSALRLLLLDLKMKVVGEAADWSTTLAQAPISRTDMLLVDWDLLPSAPNAALEDLRKACPAALVIVLISHLDARQQAALSAGADAFISKGETPERVAERLRLAAASVPVMPRAPADTATQVFADMAIQVPADTATQVLADTATQVLADTATQVLADTAIQAPANPATQVLADTAIQAPADPAMQAPTDPAIPPG